MRFLILCALIGLAAAKVDYSGHRVYRAYPTQRENDIIKSIGEEFQLDFWSEYAFLGDSVDFRVPVALQPRIEKMLEHHGIPLEIFIEDLELLLREQTSLRDPQMKLSTFDYTVYHTYVEIDEWITNFAASSALVTAVDMGTGQSLEGRNMRAIKLSTGANRNAFVINCGLHAREWVTPATCMYVANTLLTSYNNNDKITALMNAIDFYLVPTANPDGYVYTWTDDRMWRKTRNTPTASGCSVSCFGVDPNRNFDAHWNLNGGSSTNCCAQDFRGPSSFSEIETQNQCDFVNGIEKVKAYIDVHAYSQMWMYPYGWTTTDSLDEADLNEVGTASVAAIRGVHGKRYQTGSIADVIYVATGSTADYFYDQGIKCSFAAELRDKGAYGFALPEDQIIPTGEEAFAGLMTIAEYIVGGTCN